MPNLVRTVLAFLAGIVIGGGVNMALITLSPWLIHPPAGVDVSSAEGMRQAREACCTSSTTFLIGRSTAIAPLAADAIR